MASALRPVGTNDRSQAIYCLEQVQLRIRPVGDGMIGSGRRATIRDDKSTRGKDQTVPTGRIHFETDSRQ
jgi:hypothetical protein